MKNIVLTILTLLIIVSEAMAEDVQDVFSSMEKIDQFVWNGPVFLEGVDTEEKIKGIGKLLKEDIKTEVDPYSEGNRITIVYLYFEGLEIIYVRGPINNPILISSVVVKSASWKIKGDLGVGSSARKIVAALGNKFNWNGNKLEYSGVSESVTYYLMNNVVTEIHFSYYMG